MDSAGNFTPMEDPYEAGKRYRLLQGPVDVADDDELEMELRRANSDDDPLIDELQSQVTDLRATLATRDRELEALREALQQIDEANEVVSCVWCGQYTDDDHGDYTESCPAAIARAALAALSPHTGGGE